MSKIKFARVADYKKEFTDGLSREQVFVGEHAEVQVFRCTLAPGAKWQPELCKAGEQVQMLLFSQGKGYVATPRDAFSIKEVSLFVPDFDNEWFFIQANTELTFLQIIETMSDYDRTDMHEMHISLPRFRPVSQAWTYAEHFKSSEDDITSYQLIEHRMFGRMSMGAIYGMGPNTVGQHIHPELDQWYYALPGYDMTYHVDGEDVPLNGGDISFTPHNTWHGSSAEAGKPFRYVWFEFCENGYPGQIQ